MSPTVVRPTFSHLRVGLRTVAAFGNRRIRYLLAAAIVALVVLVAADVTLIANPAPTVQVVTVIWYAGPASLVTSNGFTIHASQKFVLSETCSLFCASFKGASVSAPFSLVGLSIVNQPIQYVNLTIQAPAAKYDGMLGITLDIGLLPGTASTVS
jgi:hypothetical protein